MGKDTGMIDRPDVGELVTLRENQSKVEWHPDTRFPLCGSFIFHLEDHTIGAMLRAHLLKDSRVQFSGYRVPHPLEAKMELRLMTVTESPFSCLMSAIKAQRDHLLTLKTLFKASAAKAKVRQSQAGGGLFLEALYHHHPSTFAASGTAGSFQR